jgi:cobalt-zinc-cadmium efflux system membrane fusion protein
VVPDLTASADVTLDFEQQATLAPLASIFQDGSAKPVVFVRSAEGWQKREVELGMRNNLAVAVRSGLSKGDVVALDMPTDPYKPSS